jgi:ADP-ribose pyrophosphatase YjhB (NUDIX family)
MRGATVVVRRGDEILVLRRTEFHANGDWEWTPPAGVSEDGETAHETAVRELREETGLELPLTLVRDGEWALFVADAALDARVVLSDEHDRHEWLAVDEACARCRPALVADGIREALG